MTQPWYENMDWKRRQPLKYKTGGETIQSVVLAGNSWTADSAARKLVAAGQVVCEITSGADDGKYGPYKSSASDGTQALTAGAVGILLEGHDLAFGDQPAAIVTDFAAFDVSELSIQTAHIYGAGLASLKTAFPDCTVVD